MFDLYVDGGVADKNPSSLGGTYAYVLLKDDVAIHTESGSFHPEDIHVDVVTNNHAELLAMLMGMEYAQDHHLELRYVYSDSKVTLGRVFKGWAMNNVPRWIIRAVADLHINGTKGVFVRGHSGDRWNEYCDLLCQREAIKMHRKRR